MSKEATGKTATAVEKETITIADVSQLHAVIDEIGDLQAEVTRLERQIKVRTSAAEEWAIAHHKEAFRNGSSDKTEKYDYELKPGVRSIRREPGKSQDEVLQLMGDDEKMKKYVYTALDTKLLRVDFGGSAAKRESLTAYGLCFTEPSKSKLVVGE